MTEIELIDGCRRENNSARKMLYEIYSKQMLGICIRYTGDKMIAQDLLHDGFIKVFMSICNFEHRGNGSLKAWISRIVTNTCLEYLRKNESIKEIELQEWKEPEETPGESDFETIPNDELVRFISELPDGYRTIFNLYIIEEYTHKEISKKLGINESSSRSQLSRAKNILLKKVKEFLRNNE